MDLIPPAEIAIMRSSCEFVEWFEPHLDRINTDENLKSPVLLHKRDLKVIVHAKFVFEEIFPLYRLLKNERLRWTDFRFMNVIGDQNYDVIAKADGKPDAYLEITVTDFDRSEALRMEDFMKHGRVSAIGKVGKDRGVITVDSEVRVHSEIVDETEKRIKDAILKKCEKDYEDNTSLLVYFDDYVAFSRPVDEPRMNRLLASVDQVWRRRFQALFLVGASGKVWDRGEIRLA